MNLNQCQDDKLIFDELKLRYSFGRTSDRRNLFTNMLVHEIQQIGERPVVLDIGCGSGLGEGDRKFDFVRQIKKHCGQLWGVEPDASVEHQPGLFDRIETSSLEESSLPDGSIDLAFSHFVMEHVQHPVEFFQRLNRMLKPGGVYFFITPNGNSYFVKIANFLKRLRLEEALLYRLKSKDQVEQYHYPVCYRCNHPEKILQMAKSSGFVAEFAYFERRGAPSYFPGALKPILWILNKKRLWLRNPKCLINLVVRMKKNET